MTQMKKFRVYVRLETRISTEVMATDKEHAKAQIDALDIHEGLQHICGREWDCWETSGGVYKANELVMETKEVER